MRRRWLVSILVILGLAMAGGRVALLAQQAKSTPSMPVNYGDAREGAQKGWKSPGDPQVKTAQAGVSEPIPGSATDSALPNSGRAVDPAPVDPMIAVDAFLERNRKEADDAIRALNEEAEALRARLQKVEAALGRWQAVSGALNLDSRPPQGEPGPAQVPTQLEAIPSTEGMKVPAPTLPESNASEVPPANVPTNPLPPVDPTTAGPPPVTAPEPIPAPKIQPPDPISLPPGPQAN